jgi:hypothetical protein
VVGTPFFVFTASQKRMPVVLMLVVLRWYICSLCGVPASYAPVPIRSLCGATFLFGVRCAGVIGCSVWFYRTPVVPWGARMPLRQASVIRQPAQPAVPADRFAPKIGEFFRVIGGTLAAAERQSVRLLGRAVGNPVCMVKQRRS